MSNEEQIAFWNGDAGRTWAARDAQMARMLAPVSAALCRHADLTGIRRAIDIGCGGGSSTLHLADLLSAESEVLGVDVSEPMLAVARESLARRPSHRDGSAARVSFVRADAESDTIGTEAFDLLYSRFGVMFFADPYAAFGNLRSQMAARGRLAFCCWKALHDNPWTALPLKAALSVLPPPPKPAPRSPGPFAFADKDYVCDILERSGWTAIDATPQEIDLTWPGEEGLASAVRELLNTGPVGRLLIDQDDTTRGAVHAAATELLGDHYRDGVLQLTGAVWLVTARNPA